MISDRRIFRGKRKTAVSLTVRGGFLNYSGFMLVRIDNACPMR